ncbi:MAG: hypothetical protein OEY19_11045 [Gammaproteobacteria bacterium]|nr:hypothetical protein [Gammaproteobacteria bacterium]
MYKKPLIKIGLVVGVFSLAVGIVTAGDTKKLIKQAQSAAPHSVSGNATIMSGGKVLKEGSNGWVCMPDTMPGDGSPMCNDAMWMAMMDAVGKKAEFKADGIGISYMLKGEGKGAGVSNSDPYHPDPQKADDYVESGPHMMIIVPKELLNGMTDDPKSGGPFVMWKDTPYAHIMVPISKNKR